ncbi:armadillo-type protein [Baffinella frigidus]|nr:armadillo-type protein [Cryptophyta sp. CCMP2293]
MGDERQKLTGVIEDDAPWLVGTILGRTPEEMEFAAKKIYELCQLGPEERKVLLDHGAVQALCIMCTREYEPRTQSRGAQAIGALASNFTLTLDESKIYFYEAAQEEALAQGIVPLLAPALSSWQPESQAAAAQALANVAYRNPSVRKEMARVEVCRPLVNLVHSENHGVHTAALCALRAYALDARYAIEVDQRGGLPQVCRLVFSEKSEAVARALDLLCEKSEAVARALDLFWLLAGADTVKAKIAKERDGSMLRQAKIPGERDGSMLRQVVGCVKSKNGSVVVGCVKSKNGSVVSGAVALLRKMAAVPEYRREIYDLSAHVDLVPMITKVDDQTQLNAIGCIAALCLQEDQRTQIKTCSELLDRLQKLANPPKQGDRAVPRNQALAQRAHALARVLEA